jgi:hypothetical protein
MDKFGLQPVESFFSHSLAVATDQIADVLADVLVGSILANARGHEIAQRAIEADRNRRGSRHHALRSPSQCSI